MELSERDLRFVIPLPEKIRLKVIEFVVENNLSSNQVAVIAKSVANGDLSVLRRKDPREHVPVSWRSLVSALPDTDRMGRLFSALRTELSALDYKTALRRYEQLTVQRERAAEFIVQVEALREVLLSKVPHPDELQALEDTPVGR
jgi:hypothetical protein